MKNTVWKAAAKSAGYILLFFGCQYIASFLVIATILGARVVAGESLEAALEGAAMGQLTFINETMILSTLLFVGVVLLIKRRKFLEETEIRKTSVTSVFAAALMGFSCYWAAGLLINLMTGLFPAVQSSQDAYMDQYDMIQSAQPSLWADMLYACLVGPFVEELLCRGLMWSLFKKQNTKPITFVFISGVLFALMHGNLYQVVFTLPLGMLLAYLVCRSGSLWPAFALHAAFNSGNYLVRVGEALGFEAGSEAQELALLGVLGFFILCIPASISLLKSAFGGDFSLSRGALATEGEDGGIKNFLHHKTTFPGGQDMAAPEYLIVGLGNPGDKYARTRHNCGFLALDYIAMRENVRIDRVRFRALTGEAVLEGKKVLLMKPQTFMNLSGEAVREAAAFYKIPPQKILVIFDDISFQPGVFRIRKNGSAGGHNGVKSIIENLSSQEFCRIKMGIGAPLPGWALMDWVLAPLSDADQDRIVAEMEDIYSTALHFVRSDLDRAGALFNGKIH